MISQKDQNFIADLLEDELDADALDLLDEKLKDPSFKSAYDRAVEEKYAQKKGKLQGYLPMIVLILLILVGIYLIVK